MDEIILEFRDSNGIVVASQTVLPRTGQNSAGANGNDIVAETIDLDVVAFAVKSISATLNGSNGQLDFQNFVFLGVN